MNVSATPSTDERLRASKLFVQSSGPCLEAVTWPYIVAAVADLAVLGRIKIRRE